MNTFKINFSRLLLIFNREAIQEQSIFFWNIPSFFIKAMAAMILLPCFFKPVLAEPVDIASESSDSEIVNREFTDKNISNAPSPDRAFKLRDDERKSTFEIGTKVSLTNLPSISVKKVSTNTGKDKKPSESFDTQLAILFGFFITVLFQCFLVAL